MIFSCALVRVRAYPLYFARHARSEGWNFDAASETTGFRRAQEALGHRFASWFRGAGELFRPGEFVGISGSSARYVRNFGGDVRLFVEHVQLVVRSATASIGDFTGSFRRA